MHILYIHQYYSTPNGIKVTRAYEFSRFWRGAGHRVTVLTSTANLTQQDLADFKGRFIKRYRADDMEIIVFDIPYNQKMGKFRRYLAWVFFLLVSIVYSLKINDVDVIYARSTPLTTGIPAMLARFFRKIPYVFEVTDQWPEIPIEMGVIRNPFLKKFFLWLERAIYRHCDAIITCSPGMTAGVQKVMDSAGLKPKPIATIPNFSETDVYGPHIDGTQLREEKGWQDKTVLLHAGTMGRANGLDFLVDAAEKLRDNRTIHFVLIGDGSDKHALRKRVEQLRLNNVEILDPVVKSGLPEYVAACDVALVIFADYPILEHNSANKFFDSLSAGKPVLLNYSGWQRDVLENGQAGFGCKRCNLDEFVEKVLHLTSNKELRSQMGRNARRIAEEEFDRDTLSGKVLDVLKAAHEK